MKTLKILAFGLISLIMACGSSTDSNESLNFEDLNISYSKSGGWINHYSLNIDSTGFVEATVRLQSNWEMMDSNATVLTTSEKKKLCNVFESFKGLNDYYEPKHFYTDQNYHTIILRTATGSDTTSVYDPAHCNLPNDLNRIIIFMDNKIDDLLN